MNVCEKNFKALARIVDMEAIRAFTFESAKSESGAFMALNFDYLSGDEKKATIALSHYYTQNGDAIPDPDMELEIDFEAETVRALSYQDAYTFKDVRRSSPAIAPLVERSLNGFLNQWLRNLRAQGHRIDTAAIARAKSSHRIEPRQVDHA